MGKNQSEKQQVKVKNGALPPKDIQFPASIKEVVETDWKVALLLEEHPDFTGKVYIAKFTSKWGNTDTIYCVFSDLFDKKKQRELTKELVNRGRFHPDELQAFIQYLDCLKVTEQTISNDEGYKQHILGTTELTNIDEAEKVYRAIVEHALENESVFPSKDLGGYRDEHDGVRLDQPKEVAKYGEYAIAFEASKLRDLLEVTNTKKFNAILGDLAKKGVFFPGSSENRKKITLRTGYAPHCYIFKIDESVLTKGGM
ncbi:hypothetical protein [Pseudobacillus badius]|uniref:hypothetical protein n=1 Tax=Bacillus badius TaxID=1455 RepID=UPI0007B050B0|nr:hypothetical protein [Bacillus badius]KZO00428.1 hypothetical protein A4244_15935 [Bacillus badius]OCS86737.1 hypothetical protein A6M11_15950 [Bacillus badius]OVE46493.1 hypothetical protein B1A98_19410 [Bacillus badius]TDV97966.1 hypothetical protein B0G66_1302 [Bacillus badius]